MFWMAYVFQQIRPHHLEDLRPLVQVDHPIFQRPHGQGGHVMFVAAELVAWKPTVIRLLFMPERIADLLTPTVIGNTISERGEFAGNLHQEVNMEGDEEE